MSTVEITIVYLNTENSTNKGDRYEY